MHSTGGFDPHRTANNCFSPLSISSNNSRYTQRWYEGAKTCTNVHSFLTLILKTSRGQKAPDGYHERQYMLRPCRLCCQC